MDEGPQASNQGAGGPRVRVVNFGQPMSAAFKMAQGQPNWAVRAAVLTFLVLVGLPILLLLLVAGLAAAVVFSILASANWVLSRMKGSRPPHDGRRNVRVMEPKD